MITLKPLFNLSAELEDVLDFGAGPAGHMRVFKIKGGTFEGERVRGSILGGGGDWQTMRADGVVELDVRCLMQADSGALIHLTGQGLRHGPPDLMARMSRGEDVPAEAYYFREFMRFKTSAPELDWMNKLFALATGSRRRSTVHLEVFEVL